MTAAEKDGEPASPRISAAQGLAWLSVAVSLLLLLVPVSGDAVTVRAAGAVVLAIGLWSTGAVPEYVTAVLFFLVTMVFAIAPAAVVFSGFHSTAIWLIFGGMVLGLGVQQSGLGNRLVSFVLRQVSGPYFVYVLALALVGLALGFVVPSAMGRVMLLIPIVLAVADRLGFPAGSQGRAGLVMGTALATMLPSFGVLPSNVPNVTMAGAAESIYGVTFQYGAYLALNFPVLSLMSFGAVVVIVSRTFHEPPRQDAAPTEPAGWTRNERVLLLILLLTLALWASDFLHGVSPAWVALGAAVLCLLPRTGVVGAGAFTKEANFGPWLYVAGVIGMGAVANHTGLGQLVGEALFAAVEFTPGADARNFASLLGIGAVVSLITTHPAAPAIMTPLAESFAAATGWPLRDVLLAQVPAWVVFPFPYQAPPVFVAMTLAGVPVRQATRVLFTYFAFGVLVIWPLHFMWGRALGFFG